MTHPELPQPPKEERLILYDPREPGHESHPAVWLQADSPDYGSGGRWLCAAHDVGDLNRELARAQADGELPPRLAIRDQDGFEPWTAQPDEDLDTIARVATGIAKHGRGFAAWADIMDADPDMLAVFNDYYQGSYPSPAAWAGDRLGGEITAHLDAVVRPDLRDYLHVDYAALAAAAFEDRRVHFYPDAGQIHAFLIDPDWQAP